MDKQHLALNLAATLANGPWAARDLEAALKRRLPDALGRYAEPLSADIFAQNPGPFAPGATTLARSR